MKYVSVVLAVAVALLPASSFAGCPDRHSICCGYDYFTFDTSCASTSGSVNTATLSCYSWDAYQWNGSGSVDYQMTVPSDLGTLNTWSVSIYVDFDDPEAYSGDVVSATVIVWHNGRPSYTNSFFFHDGTQGSLSCDIFGSGYFTASAGDTIEVSMTGSNYYSYYGTSMKISTPFIFDN